MGKYPLIEEQINLIKSGKSSFLGMDGGNINAILWFCGVEFGATLMEMEDYYSSQDIDSCEADEYEIPYRVAGSNWFLNSTFDRRLALTYSILTGGNENPEKEELDDILKNKLYHKDSKTFKLNLYPLAKPDTGWDKDIERDLNVSKADYYGKLFNNRIKFIQDLVKRFSPKTILCFSPNGYSEIFIDTFIPNRSWVDYQKDLIPLDKERTAKITVFRNQDYQLIIVPFLGRGNLNSYADVKQVTKYLKSNYL